MIITVTRLDGPMNGNSMYILPKKVIKRAIKDPIIKEKIKNNSFFGTLNDIREITNPFTNTLQHSNIDMTKIAFRIKSLFIKDDMLKADIDILDTPKGQMLRTLIDEDRYLVSIEGNAGSYNVTVYDDTFVLTADIVTISHIVIWEIQ